MVENANEQKSGLFSHSGEEKSAGISKSCKNRANLEITYFPSGGGSDRIRVKAAAASSRAQDTLEVNRLIT